jgi:hypothetical protein
MPMFLDVVSEGRFHLLFRFLQFFDSERYSEATCGSEDCINVTVKPLAVQKFV